MRNRFCMACARRTACTVSGITTEGRRGRASATRSAMPSVAAELLSLVGRPSANDISAGRVILRQPDAQGETPGVAAFAQHGQQFFSAWAQ